jgi:hypothetical protein
MAALWLISMDHEMESPSAPKRAPPGTDSLAVDHGSSLTPHLDVVDPNASPLRLSTTIILHRWFDAKAHTLDVCGQRACSLLV